MVNVNYRMVRWGVAIILFLAIALTALAFLMKPPIVMEKSVTGEDRIVPAGLEQNLGLLRETWTRYPAYTTGLTTLLIIGVVGSGFSIYSLYKEKDLSVEEEPA